MSNDPVTLEDLRGVFAVPPLPRRTDARRTLDLDAAERVARHIAEGGITRFLYGGNAFLYHVTLAEYEALLDWLADFPAPRWAIPSLGPVVRPRDRSGAPPAPARLPHRDGAAVRRSARAARLEAGLREIADAAGMPLIIYLKSEDGFGTDREQSAWTPSAGS